MWFEPHSIANILLLAIMNKHYLVAFNTTDNFFTVHLQDREIIFIQSEGAIYYFDTVAEENFVGAIITSAV